MQTATTPYRNAFTRDDTHDPRPMYAITLGPSFWKVKIWRNGTHVLKAFSFRKLGGRDAALVQAKAWRDEVIRNHPPMLRKERADVLLRHNKSGIPGVRCQVDATGQPRLWVAETQLAPGVRQKRVFNVRRYGDHEARSMAIAERKNQLAQVEGRYFKRATRKEPGVG